MMPFHLSSGTIGKENSHAAEPRLLEALCHWPRHRHTWLLIVLLTFKVVSH